MDNVKLYLPSNTEYSCTFCGKCCSNLWEIPLTENEANKLCEVDWHSCSSLPESAETPATQSAINEKQLKLCGVGSDCNFLGTDRKCRLHAKFGAEIKPFTCRMFPFGFTDTPDGVYVGTSFFCPSIVANSGAPIEELKNDFTELIKSGAVVNKIQNPVNFAPGITIEWDDYKLIEGALDAIIGNNSEPVSVCLGAGHAWIGMLYKLLRQSGASVKEVIAFYVKSTAEEGYERAFNVARRSLRTSHTPVKRIMLGTLISFCNSMRKKRSRASIIGSLTFTHLRHWLGFGSIVLPPLDKSVAYTDLLDTPDCFLNTEGQTLLRRYFRHSLFRKDLITVSDLLWGYSYMILVYGLIEWYAIALEGEPDQLNQALQLVEKEFVHHSGFNRFFFYYPSVERKFRAIFMKPNFPMMLLGGGKAQ